MKIEEIAENALKIISSETEFKEIKQESFLNLNEIREVLAKGGCVILKKENLDAPCDKNALELILSLKRLGINVFWETPDEAVKKSASGVSTSPDKQVLEEILEEVIDKESPCIIEPVKTCINCSGRCKTLGF